MVVGLVPPAEAAGILKHSVKEGPRPFPNFSFDGGRKAPIIKTGEVQLLLLLTNPCDGLQELTGPH